MSPFPKRQRLFAPVERDFPQSFDSEEAYYDETPDDEMADFVDDAEEEGEEGEEPDLDNDSLFQERRARLDYKLKSTLEAIFEKYGRDFEGIGDEIDMATGEIVVNNGHILNMQDEMDAGETLSSDALSDSADELVEGPVTDLYESSEPENDVMESEDEEVEGEEVYESYDEGVGYGSDVEPDDDLLIRGPTAGVQRMFPIDYRREKGKERLFGPDILAEFGPKVGPRVLAIVSQMQAPDDSHVEPAWRVPEIPTPRPTKRPAVKRTPVYEDIERSLSPEARTSVWAPAGKHASQKQRKRVVWTPEEDQILLKAVSRGLREGRKMMTICVELAIQYPGKDWWNLHSRYDKLVTVPNQIVEPDESDLTSEASVFKAPGIDRLHNAGRFPAQSKAADSGRPARIRKPPQTNPAIRTWQEAVPLLDPEEHAELLEDNRKMTTSKPRIDHTEHSQRTYSALQTQPNNEMWVKQYDTPQPPQKDPISRCESIEATPEVEQPFIVGAPCGHIDCANSKTKYKLQRRSNEDTSEMNVHLFQIHHMTPYPCSEANCPKTGVNGFFLQDDLVNHVRGKHPGVEAWRRLRGRVSSELFDRSPKKSIARQNQATDINRRPHSHQKASKSFISPVKPSGARKSSSSGARSSHFDPDRTITPRIADQNDRSTWTPMTSVSSMRVHPSSGTIQQGGYPNESQEPLAQPHQASVELEGSGYYHLREYGSYSSLDEQPSPRRLSSKDSVAKENGGSEPLRMPAGSLATSHPPHTSLESPDFSLSTSELVPESKNECAPTISAILAASLSSVPTQAHQSELQEIPNSSSIPPTPISRPIHGNLVSGTQNTSGRQLLLRSESPFIYSRKSQASVRPLSRGDSSNVAPMTATQATGKSPVVTSVSTTQVATSMIVATPQEAKLPQNPQKSPKATPTTNAKPKASKASSLAARPKHTPSNAKKQTKTAFRKLFRGSEVDELSLGDDDLKLLSIRKRHNPKPDLMTRIKREGTGSPQVLSAVPAKKRKLSMMQGSDEVDELGSDPVDIVQPTIQPTIKQEEEDTIPPLVMARNDVAKRPDMHLKSNSRPSKPGPAQQNSSNTPLLDLTPSRTNSEREIRDSADVSSPARRKEVPTSSSPIDGLLTPVGQKGWDENFHKQFKIPVTVRTPGGTLRCCGVEGFRCGKFICHRCASVAEEQAM